ncbi:MAG: N-acetyltransferase GCN5 [Methylocystaceae bacterium]|nr:MAG: N-acetyltransferase GCN5 [Methylocystaceae bacterium]KAF0211749.1 MAG: N-acetyltransferase [Methylocystaceae bacterium]TXT47115.1 MAG: N-acetyltransferase GCN5 [Methylocystaceae bacterium]
MTRSANLREETPEDHSAIGGLLVAAFDRYGEAELVEALRKEGDLVFGGVAAIDGDIIGYVALSRMRAPFPALGLGPIAVAARHRQKGVASTLLHWSLAHVQKDQWPAIFVLGDGAFYGRFGFRPELAAGFGTPYAGPHFMALALNGELPAKEGQVDYAPAFDQL